MPATVLFELSELASYIQTDLDTASATLARDLATGVLQAETGQRIFRATSTVELQRDPFNAKAIRLPQAPAVSVATVVDEDGNAVTAFELHGQVLEHDTAWSHLRHTVTYTHGFDTVIPPTLRAVALACAARVLVNPGGVRQVSVADVSTSYAGSDADLTSGAYLTDREKAMARAVFGRPQPMVPVR